MSNSKILKIKALKSSSTIGVFSSSSALSAERVNLAINNIKKLGYQVKMPLNPSLFYAKYDHSFFAGSLEQRLDSVNQLLDDPQVDVLIAARGAYGTQELLPHLDYQKIKKSQKAIIGMSDITSLLLAVTSQSEVAAIHGATFGSSFADYHQDAAAKESVDQLIKILSDKEYRLKSPLKAIRKGTADGRIICGNLTMLSLAIGTKYDMDFSNAILVLEDVGEKPYQVQRNLLHLQASGKLEKLAGLVFGRFSKCESAKGPTVEEAISYFIDKHLVNTSYPIYKDLAVGHYGLNIPLPWGVLAEIKEEQFSLLESPLI